MKKIRRLVKQIPERCPAPNTIKQFYWLFYWDRTNVLARKYVSVDIQTQLTTGWTNHKVLLTERVNTESFHRRKMIVPRTDSQIFLCVCESNGLQDRGDDKTSDYRAAPILHLVWINNIYIYIYCLFNSSFIIMSQNLFTWSTLFIVLLWFGTCQFTPL